MKKRRLIFAEKGKVTVFNEKPAGGFFGRMGITNIDKGRKVTGGEAKKLMAIAQQKGATALVEEGGVFKKIAGADNIDDMYAHDLEKVGKDVPSELALNAAKVRAAQRGDKKGAEKPDLYAKGKGVGKGGKPAKDEENDERKSKGPNKGEKKDPNAPDKQQGAKSKDDMDKAAYYVRSDGKNFTYFDRKTGKKSGVVDAKHPNHTDFKRAFDRAGHGTKLQWDGSKTASLGLALAASDTMTRGAEDRDLIKRKGGLAKKPRFIGGQVGQSIHAARIRRAQKAGEKTASEEIDDQFAIDIHQAVGADVPSADPDWQRPDVAIADSATDAIDESFLSWMRDKNDEDRVKTASGLKGALKTNFAERGHDLVTRGGTAIGKAMKGERVRGLAEGAGLTVAGAGAVLAGKKGVDAVRGRGKKTAGFREEYKKNLEHETSRSNKAQAAGGAIGGAAVGGGVGLGMSRGMSKKLRAISTGVGAVSGALGGAGGALTGKAVNKAILKKMKANDAKKSKKGEKTAAVIQCDENMDLLARVRARAQATKETGDVDVVTEDT